MKKYELTDEYIAINEFDYKKNTLNDIKLHRIRSLRDFGDVKKGDLGGYIESECNLSDNGSCWVYDLAQVYGYAKVSWNSKIRGRAFVRDFAQVGGCAEVCDFSNVGENSVVIGNARICGGAKICGKSVVMDDAVIDGNVEIKLDCEVYENALIENNSKEESICLRRADIGEEACIKNQDDFVTIDNIGSRNDRTTFYRTKEGIYVSCGCFNDSLSRFEEAIEKYDNDKYIKLYNEYKEAIQMAKVKLGD